MRTDLRIYKTGVLPAVRVFADAGADSPAFVAISMDGCRGDLTTWEGPTQLMQAGFSRRTYGELCMPPEYARALAHRILEALDEAESEPEMEQLRRTA